MSNLYIFFFLAAVGIFYSVYSHSDVKELKCLVCTRVIEEMQKNISKTDSKKKINVGGYRLDDEGNYSEKKVPYSRSEIHLTELMDNICHKMDDYVRATYKENGKLTVISLVTEEGGMNPIMSEVDLVQDADLNKSLKFYCEDILGDYHETFMEVFKETETNLIAKLCGEAAQLCDREDIEAKISVVDEL